MPFSFVGVNSVSFGPEGGDGSDFSLGNVTVQIRYSEDTAESGVAEITTTVRVEDPEIDQMASSTEAAILKVSLSSCLEGDALKASMAECLAIRITDSEGHVSTFPRCFHSEIKPSLATFTATDILDDSGKTYWAIHDGVKNYGNKKIVFPDSI